jgi:hypothetical protein
MSEEYVSQVLLEINGQSITDFKAVVEKEVEIHKPVNLMNVTGHIGVQPRYGASVDYVVPKDGPEYDFSAVRGGTLTIDKQNGVRVKYTGVYTLKIGETRYDGENEAVRTIEFSAKKKQ